MSEPGTTDPPADPGPGPEALRGALRTPRSAAVAGIVFAVILTVVIVLIRTAVLSLHILRAAPAARG